MTLTPGAYLKCRRTAAGMSVDHLASVLAMPGVMDEFQITGDGYADCIMRIEADISPASWTTIVALRAHIPFDLAVLERLTLIHLGEDLPPPRLCRICAASDSGAIGLAIMPWGWAAPDLCIGCSLPPVGEAAAA